MQNNANVVFVTGNADKAKQFSRNIGLEVEHKKLELDEIQTTDNSLLVEHKVKQAYEMIKRPVLVEDVALVFESWGALPGPFIKFFVDEGVDKLCRMLDGFESRRAIGFCTYGYFDGVNLKIFDGRIAGTIADSPRGKAGYGFDRIFEPDGFGGKTAGELDDQQYQQYYRSIKSFDSLTTFLKAKAQAK